MSSESNNPDPKHAAPAGTGRDGAPAWVVPLYVGGLIVLYVGERVLGTYDTARLVVSGVGTLAVLGATAARFVPTWQAGGERGRIEKVLGIFSIVGVVALCLYLATTEWGMTKLGLQTAADQTRERVHGFLSVAWVVLVVVSVLPMLFAEAALAPMRNAERLESRRVRSAAVAGLTIAVALVYSALFVYSAAGSTAKIDFSYFKTSEPSESTRKIVDGLNEPIRVVAFFPEVNPVRTEVKGYLEKLAAGSKNLKFEMADRYLQPQLAKDMKIIQDGVIVIQRGEAKRTLNIGTDMKEAEKSLKTLDRDFQERLYKLLRERRNLYVTVGHGEINDEPEGTSDEQSGRSARILKTLLGKQNYTLKNLGLSQGLATDVPNDADIVMVLGPSEPFAPEELASLQRYAARGGKLFLALDPDALSAENVETAGASSTTPPDSVPPKGASKPANEKPKTTAKTGKPDAKGDADKAASSEKTNAGLNETGQGTDATLEALAKMVGVEFSSVVLADDKQFARRRYNDSDHTLLVTNRFSSHPSVTTLSRNSSRAAVLIGGAGSVKRAEGTTAKVDIALRAPSSTFADLNHNYNFDPATEKRDSYGIAAAVTDTGGAPPPAKKEPAKKTDIPDVPMPKEMRAFVLADADAITDLALSNAMTNQLLVVDALRWLGGEESFAGEVNSEEDVSIQHTQQKDLVWFYSTIFGAPALVLGLGLAYSKKSRQPRRKKK
jgi:hypothetical protein